MSTATNPNLTELEAAGSGPFQPTVPDQSETIIDNDLEGRFVRYNKLLGSGAFKTVWKGFDEEEGIDVAWNQIKLDRFPDAEKRKLAVETELLAQLNHPNIIRFYGSWVDKKQDKVVFITEVMTTGSLKTYIHRNRAYKLKIIKRWCRQILKGLNYLHSCDPPIIHRDLKCDNIFVNGHVGEVKIGDLGLSTVRRQKTAASVIGTPEFMAPELYDEEYDESVDIYAFGMCVLEMVTQQTPYSECENAAQIFKRVSQGRPPVALYTIADTEVFNFILRCLGPREQRPSASELLESAFLSDLENEKNRFPCPLKDPAAEPNPYPGPIPAAYNSQHVTQINPPVNGSTISSASAASSIAQSNAVRPPNGTHTAAPTPVTASAFDNLNPLARKTTPGPEKPKMGSPPPLGATPGGGAPSVSGSSTSSNDKFKSAEQIAAACAPEVQVRTPNQQKADASQRQAAAAAAAAASGSGPVPGLQINPGSFEPGKMPSAPPTPTAAGGNGSLPSFSNPGAPPMAQPPQHLRQASIASNISTTAVHGNNSMSAQVGNSQKTSILAWSKPNLADLASTGGSSQGAGAGADEAGGWDSNHRPYDVQTFPIPPGTGAQAREEMISFPDDVPDDAQVEGDGMAIARIPSTDLTKAEAETSDDNVVEFVLRLQLPHSLKEIQFPFDMESDTPEVVAAEMVSEMGLPQSVAPTITENIEDLVTKLQDAEDDGDDLESVASVGGRSTASSGGFSESGYLSDPSGMPSSSRSSNPNSATNQQASQPGSTRATPTLPVNPAAPLKAPNSSDMISHGSHSSSVSGSSNPSGSATQARLAAGSPRMGAAPARARGASNSSGDSNGPLSGSIPATPPHARHVTSGSPVISMSRPSSTAPQGGNGNGGGGSNSRPPSPPRSLTLSAPADAAPAASAAGSSGSGGDAADAELKRQLNELARHHEEERARMAERQAVAEAALRQAHMANRTRGQTSFSSQPGAPPVGSSTSARGNGKPSQLPPRAPSSATSSPDVSPGITDGKAGTAAGGPAPGSGPGNNVPRPPWKQGRQQAPLKPPPTAPPLPLDGGGAASSTPNLPGYVSGGEGKKGKDGKVFETVLAKKKASLDLADGIERAMSNLISLGKPGEGVQKPVSKKGGGPSLAELQRAKGDPSPSMVSVGSRSSSAPVRAPSPVIPPVDGTAAGPPRQARPEKSSSSSPERTATG